MAWSDAEPSRRKRLTCPAAFLSGGVNQFTDARLQDLVDFLGLTSLWLEESMSPE